MAAKKIYQDYTHLKGNALGQAFAMHTGCAFMQKGKLQVYVVKLLYKKIYSADNTTELDKNLENDTCFNYVNHFYTKDSIVFESKKGKTELLFNDLIFNL